MAEEDRHPWDRLQDEPNRWYQRFERFRLLGPDRSLLAIFNQWRLEKSRGVSTSVPRSWRHAAELWRWHERAEAWDQHLSRRAAETAESERLRILSSGYAQQHERVRVLDELAALLLGELREQDKRWLPDVRQIGSGEDAERVDIVRFNAALIEQFRDTLDDLASETGGRVRNIDVKSNGKAVPVISIEVIPPSADTLGDPSAT